MRDSAALAGVSYQGESDRALNTQGRWLKGWPESRRGHEASASTGMVCPFLTSLLSKSDERRTPTMHSAGRGQRAYWVHVLALHQPGVRSPRFQDFATVSGC